MTKTAIILFNLGGPNNLSAVKPFLFNLFNDRAIINLANPFRFLLAKLISNLRQKKASNIYRLIGGKSPLLEITNEQALALEQKLSKYGDFKVFVAMRYWHPFSFEIIDKILNYQPNQVILLPLYPQFSTTTSKSSINDFIYHFNQKNGGNQKITVKSICCYPTHHDFINAHASLLKAEIDKSGQDLDNFIKNFRILFSAHGLPQKVINQGDPYVYQLEQTVNLVTLRLRELLKLGDQKVDFTLCFQSKVGPLKWTSPSLDQEMRRAALDQKSVVIVPIAFVSEHSETLVELDIDYKNLAKELAIKHYLRVPALNIDANFINCLADLCLKTANNNGKCSDFKRLCGTNFSQCINCNS